MKPIKIKVKAEDIHMPWYEDFPAEFFNFVEDLPEEIDIKDLFRSSIDFFISFGEVRKELEKLGEWPTIIHQENTVFKVKSKVIKIPKKGNLVFEIPGASQDEIEYFKGELKDRIKKDKKTGKDSIIIVGKEIKIPRRYYVKKETKFKKKK